jgi:hypothetical protein
MTVAEWCEVLVGAEDKGTVTKTVTFVADKKTTLIR